MAPESAVFGSNGTFWGLWKRLTPDLSKISLSRLSRNVMDIELVQDEFSAYCMMSRPTRPLFPMRGDNSRRNLQLLNLPGDGRNRHACELTTDRFLRIWIAQWMANFIVRGPLGPTSSPFWCQKKAMGQKVDWLRSGMTCKNTGRGTLCVTRSIRSKGCCFRKKNLAGFTKGEADVLR